VRDHGPGIAVEKRERLFERFYQAHPNGHHSGMGLGLYISRQIVGHFGGRMWVESRKGEGSIFSVALPLLQKVL